RVFRVNRPSADQINQPRTVDFHNYDAVPVQFQPNASPGPTCYRPPAYLHYNISDNSYYYPRNNIFQELTERKDILEKISKEGIVATSPLSETEDLRSRVGDGVTKGGNSGCVGYRLLLRSFDSYGGRCWVVYPRHQAVSYISCGSASKCPGRVQYGQYGACAVDERTEGVWAWCETLPFGKRITK
ncbi:hypothetical protein BaRGS_00034569, partial [Batillaria attramentaria]